MTSGAVRAFRNTHSNRYDAGFMKPHMIIVVSMSTVNMVSLRSQPRESPSCLQPSATRWLFAAGRMGGEHRPFPGIYRLYAVVLSQGLEIITGSVLK